MCEYYKINEPDIVSEEMAGEAVVINLETGYYYSLNETASAIWNFISEGLSRKQIFNFILQDYEIEKEVAERDLKDLLIQMIEEALIVEIDNNGSNEKGSGYSRDKKIISGYQRPDMKKHSDVQEMLKLDPIHEVTEIGWPNKKD